jgi:dihydrofolate synthase / folylpolyglutamate synthase
MYLPHWPIPHGSKDIILGLDRVKALLERLGSPEEKLPPVIHVAGTNGKGSTIAYLKAILEHAGYKVHRYTSPHIRQFNERIVLAGKEITDDYLSQVIEETRLAAGDLQTTFFEGSTAAAFLAFSRVKADVLLLETGLGGRLDATNVIGNPRLTVITPISEDHTEYLGNTISAIAYEKAGIIKPKVPCVISWQLKETQEVLLKKCAEGNAPNYSFDQHWNFEKTTSGFNFIDHVNEEIIPLPDPSLIGIHQIINAATAVATVKLLDDFDISYENLCYGLTNTFWPARMQMIKHGVLRDMLPSDWELWVDGAHNNGGAQMLAATIESLWHDKPTYLINGRTGNRDIKSFLAYFKDKVKLVCGVKVRSEPLGELAVNIVNGAKEIGLEAYECDSLPDAIKFIMQKSNQPSRILVCGSLYLAADVALANKQN